MKRNNYNNYSKKRDEVIKDDLVTETKIEEEIVDELPEQVAPETTIYDDIPVDCIYVQANVVPAKTEPIIGIVEGCKKLNVRSNPNPNANVLAVVDKDKELVIDLDKSTNDWYSVCTASGIDGYCMREFVTIK